MQSCANGNLAGYVAPPMAPPMAPMAPSQAALVDQTNSKHAQHMAPQAAPLVNQREQVNPLVDQTNSKHAQHMAPPQAAPLANQREQVNPLVDQTNSKHAQHIERVWDNFLAHCRTGEYSGEFTLKSLQRVAGPARLTKFPSEKAGDVILAKACEIFITDLTMRAWIQAEDKKRTTLQRQHVMDLVFIQRQHVMDTLPTATHFDFLKDFFSEIGGEESSGIKPVPTLGTLPVQQAMAGQLTSAEHLELLLLAGDAFGKTKEQNADADNDVDMDQGSNIIHHLVSSSNSLTKLSTSSLAHSVQTQPGTFNGLSSASTSSNPNNLLRPSLSTSSSLPGILNLNSPFNATASQAVHMEPSHGPPLEPVEEEILAGEPKDYHQQALDFIDDPDPLNINLDTTPVNLASAC